MGRLWPGQRKPRPQYRDVRPHFVLDLEQGLAGFQIGDDLEAVLVLVALLGDQTTLQQLPGVDATIASDA